MKTLFTNQVRSVIAVAVVGLIIAGTYFAGFPIFKTQEVKAGATQKATGWIWNGGATDPGYGWISLNSSDCDTDANGYMDSGTCGGNNSTTVARDYGVDVSPIARTGTGNFSGNAWGEYAGWISFDRATTGNPQSVPFNGGSGPIAQVDWSTGKVTGWARVLVPSGGDGWIKLSDDSIPSWSGRGVKINTTTGKFSGWAWGGDMFGWIDFAPTIGGVPMPESSQAKVPPAPPAVCTAANIDAGNGVWGACDATASCVSGGGPVQYGLTGVKFGSCTDGSTGTVTESCVAGSTSCVRSATIYIVGDGICDSALGENTTNSLADCKPKTRFWQF